MPNNQKHDWSSLTEPDACLDLYGHFARWSLANEEYSDTLYVKAIALTDSFPLTANQLMAIDGGATGAESGTNARSAFRARIIGDNSPHAFLEDPCDPSIATDTDYVYKLITMHTLFINSSITEDVPVTRGDIVLVQLTRTDQAYNLEYGRFEELLSIEDPSGTEGERCSSLISLFGAIEHEPYVGINTATSYGAASSQAAADPGTCSWSNGASRLTTTWTSTEFPAYNGKVLNNGDLESTGMLVTDSLRGTQLVPPAMADFLKLAAAYEAKFPGNTLKGSGYRSYASQVNERMKRASCKTCCDQSPAKIAALKVAATPGRSNHGWGAAVDLDRGEWTKGKGNNSPEFRWLNKFSTNFNFVFGVGTEHWHIDWMKFGAQTGGDIKTTQTAWTSAGKNDASITLT